MTPEDKIRVAIESAQERFFQALDSISTQFRVTDSEFIPLLGNVLGSEYAEGFENWINDGA